MVLHLDCSYSVVMIVFYTVAYVVCLCVGQLGHGLGPRPALSTVKTNCCVFLSITIASLE